VSSTHKIPTFQNCKIERARFSKSSSPKNFQMSLQIQFHEEEKEKENNNNNKDTPFTQIKNFFLSSLSIEKIEKGDFQLNNS